METIFNITYLLKDVCPQLPSIRNNLWDTSFYLIYLSTYTLSDYGLIKLISKAISITVNYHTNILMSWCSNKKILKVNFFNLVTFHLSMHCISGVVHKRGYKLFYSINKCIKLPNSLKQYIVNITNNSTCK